MALVNIVNMIVLDNPTTFSNPFQFEITFECLQALEDDLEWKVIYVADAEDTLKDQVLEEVLVGPVPTGTNKFVLQSEAPNQKSISDGNIIGVTVILITCSYREQEFIRVGYYVNNEYCEEYDSETGPPMPLDMSKVNRQILADKPRVTRFPIDWRTTEQIQFAQQQEQEVERSEMEGTQTSGMEEDNYVDNAEVDKNNVVSEDSDEEMSDFIVDDLATSSFVPTIEA